MGLHIVLQHALPIGVRDAEIILRFGVALISSLAVPSQRLRIILRHALAFATNGSNHELSRGVTAISERTELPERGRIVPAIVSGRRILKWACGNGRGSRVGQSKDHKSYLQQVSHGLLAEWCATVLRRED